MNFIEELRWRGMLHDIMPGTEEQLNKEMTVAYLGIDPTADSLHIGHLATIMILLHFQLSGHKPIVLIGGATGMIGDPSGKAEERKLLSEEVLRYNENRIKVQLLRFLNFKNGNNKAELVNNYDWMMKFGLLKFLREVGKHITINYMMAKDSVKKRLELASGISFTEFTYQLIQGYDFLYLYEKNNCKMQIGGSDQWGNIVTGAELVRRKTGKEVYAITCPLITKSNGGKFGKTEEGNIWLDAQLTSSYKFYQFWLNCSDEDAAKYIRIFTLFSKKEIEAIEKEHSQSPHLRALQKALAKDITIRVHSENDYNTAIKASEILFGKGTTKTLKQLDEEILLTIFEGVPRFEISETVLEQGISIVDFLAEKTNIMSSKNDARRMLNEGSVNINKIKQDVSAVISKDNLLNKKYLIVQKGKKNYFLVIVKCTTGHL